MKILITFLLFFMFWTITAQDITYVDLTQAKFGEIPASEIFEEIKIQHII